MEYSIVEPMEQRPNTTPDSTTASNYKRAELIKPLMQIPIFGTLFENIGRLLNKSTHEILEYFSGSKLSNATQPEDESSLDGNMTKTSERPLTKCEIERANSDDSLPLCDDNGNFRLLQCSLYACWCVNSAGEKIENTLLGPNEGTRDSHSQFKNNLCTENVVQNMFRKLGCSFS